MSEPKDSRKWVVLRWVPSSPPSPPSKPTWQEVAPPVGEAWEAVDAGHAFLLAVIDNVHERIDGTSYRVLPFEGGATFNVAINVEGKEHEAESAAA